MTAVALGPVRVPLRRIDCACGFIWFSPPLLLPVINGDPNVCPKCESPALAGTAGPTNDVVIDDLKLDITANASARSEK